MQFVFIVPKLRTIKIYWNYTADHLLLPHIKLKKTRGGELVILPYFLYDFLRIISSYSLLTDQISFSDCFYFVRNWEVCVLYQVSQKNFNIIINLYKLTLCHAIWKFFSRYKKPSLRNIFAKFRSDITTLSVFI